MGYFGLRNFHQPGKTFYFWVTKSKFPIQSCFHILFISFTGTKLYNLKFLSLFFFFPAPSSFILHRYFPNISFGNRIPSLHLLSQTIQTNTKALYTSEEIISGIKNRSVKIFQSKKKRKMIERKKNRICQ